MVLIQLNNTKEWLSAKRCALGCQARFGVHKNAHTRQPQHIALISGAGYLTRKILSGTSFFVIKRQEIIILSNTLCQVVDQVRTSHIRWWSWWSGWLSVSVGRSFLCLICSIFNSYQYCRISTSDRDSIARWSI